MRYFLEILVMTTMVLGEATASSFVVPEPMRADVGPSMLVLVDRAGEAASPSIIALGHDRPGTSLHSVAGGSHRTTPPAAFSAVSSPSIIALGAPPPGVAEEKVSAIPEAKKDSAPALPPMVIRGGLAGDAFPRPLPPTQAAQQGQSAVAPIAAEGQERLPSTGQGSTGTPEPAIIDAPE